MPGSGVHELRFKPFIMRSYMSQMSQMSQISHLSQRFLCHLVVFITIILILLQGRGLKSDKFYHFDKFDSVFLECGLDGVFD
jgi:hypothetical protein